MKKLLTLSGTAIYQDPEKPGMRVLLFITTVVFSILAIISAGGLFVLTMVISASAPQQDPLAWQAYLLISAFLMIPVAFVAGQWLAWRGYHRKKNNLIVLGMCLSSSPIAVFLIYLIWNA